MAFWRWVAADGVEKVRVLSRTMAVAVDGAEREFFARRRAAAAPLQGPGQPPEVFDMATPPASRP
eukprot:8778942-Alexandrium_andersonii.AAC.1